MAQNQVSPHSLQEQLCWLQKARPALWSSVLELWSSVLELWMPSHSTCQLLFFHP